MVCSGAEVQCPIEEGKWGIANNDECFVVRNPSEWGSECASGRQVTIDNHQDIASLKELLVHVPGNKAWIGLARVGPHSTWLWRPYGKQLDAKVVQLTLPVNWRLIDWGQAAGNTHECAAVMYVPNSQSPVLVSDDCNNELPYICRINVYAAVSESIHVTSPPNTIGFTYADLNTKPETEVMINGHIHYNIPTRLPINTLTSLALLTVASGSSVFSVRVISVKRLPAFLVIWGGAEIVISDVDITRKHFYVVVKANNLINFYIDGVLVGTENDNNKPVTGFVQNNIAAVPATTSVQLSTTSMDSNAVKIMSVWPTKLFYPIDSSSSLTPPVTYSVYDVNETLTSCMAMCIQHTGCLSVSYVDTTRTCLLHADYITPSSSLVKLLEVNELPQSRWVYRFNRIPASWWIDAPQNQTCNDVGLSNITSDNCQKSPGGGIDVDRCYCTANSLCRCARKADSWMYGCPSVISPTANAWVPLSTCDRSKWWFLISVPEANEIIPSIEIDDSNSGGGQPQLIYTIYMCKKIYSRTATDIIGTRCMFIVECSSSTNSSTVCELNVSKISYIKIAVRYASATNAVPVVRSVKFQHPFNDSAPNLESPSDSPIEVEEITFSPTSVAAKILAVILGMTLSLLILLGNGAYAWKKKLCVPGAVKQEDCPAIPQQVCFIFRFFEKIKFLKFVTQINKQQQSTFGSGMGASTTTRVALPNSIGDSSVVVRKSQFTSFAPDGGQNSLTSCRPKEPALKSISMRGKEEASEAKSAQQTTPAVKTQEVPILSVTESTTIGELKAKSSQPEEQSADPDSGDLKTSATESQNEQPEDAASPESLTVVTDSQPLKKEVEEGKSVSPTEVNNTPHVALSVSGSGLDFTMDD